MSMYMQIVREIELRRDLQVAVYRPICRQVQAAPETDAETGKFKLTFCKVYGGKTA